MSFSHGSASHDNRRCCSPRHLIAKQIKAPGKIGTLAFVAPLDGLSANISNGRILPWDCG
jgi:hypothetical protein